MFRSAQPPAVLLYVGFWTLTVQYIAELIESTDPVLCTRVWLDGLWAASVQLCTRSSLTHLILNTEHRQSHHSLLPM